LADRHSPLADLTSCRRGEWRPQLRGRVGFGAGTLTDANITSARFPASLPRFASRTARGYALLAPVLGLLLFALAAPMALLLLYSFWTENGLLLDTHPTLAQYADVLTREGYRTLFIRSIAISSLVTVVTVMLAYPIAYFVAFRVQRAKFIWLLLLTIPFWTSYLLRVFAWKVILGYNGVINSGLISLGLISQPLEFLLYNPAAVVVTMAHAYAAFAVLPIYVSLEKIDRSLFEAAADLGDGPARRFWRVTLPLSFPGIVAAAVLIFVPTTGDYVTPTLVGGSEGLMIANIIQVQFGRVNNWPLGAALVISSMAFVALISVFVVQAARFSVARIR
jgi:spermidine/putrescine transport system permease protein